MRGYPARVAPSRPPVAVRAPRARSPWAALGPCLLAVALAGCSGANPFDANPASTATPSPLPPGYQEPERRLGGSRPQAEGEELDAITAVVWGEVLTRRRLMRETRGTQASAEEPGIESDLQRRRIEWVREQLLVKAAEMEGIRLVPSVFDPMVEEEKARMVREYTRNTGRPVSFDEVLVAERVSEEEFRTRMRNQVLRELYLRKVKSGLGRGTRPQVDMAVTPAEVRRTYREMPGLFDEKQGASFALFQLRTIDAMVGTVSPVEAEALTQRKAEEIAAAFRAGEEPASIARRFGLDERQWRVNEQVVDRFQVPAGAAWLFDPARRAGDAQVFTFERVVGGPVVLGVREVRAAKQRTLGESWDAVVRVTRFGRELRLENQRILELAQGGAVIWPASLADEVLDDARRRLAELDADERLSRARFR